ncbi:histone deacetylase 4-like isoform X2 [Lineus longissimus]|uniref:histone deacetylase 4-like isoform X2 n=1 Tax=Lineus longissimus TaxID=88925 RepID=UPI00315CCDFB
MKVMMTQYAQQVQPILVHPYPLTLGRGETPTPLLTPTTPTTPTSATRGGVFSFHQGHILSTVQECSQDPLGPRESAMEINNHFGHLQRKEIPHSPPLGSPVMRGRDLTAVTGEGQQLHHQLSVLKQQQQLQQQMLLQQFQHQQQQLQLQHDKQIQDHIKVSYIQKQQEFLEQQQKDEVDRQVREQRELERLELIKHKKKDEQSAVASSEVKMRLQEFVLKKKQHEAAMGSLKGSPPQLRQWYHSSIDQSSPPQSGLSPPYHPRLLGAYEEDFPPLRKTASEPNLKVRSVLKQKVMDRRSSPLLKRKDKGVFLKRKPPLTNTTLCNSNPNSGPNSPPNSATGVLPSDANLGALQSQEVVPNQFYPFYLQVMKSMLGANADLNLYTSPSMPNISLGKPPSASSLTQSSVVTPETSEAELRAMAAARLGLPLTGHMLTTLPYFTPSLPVIDGEFTPPNSPAYISAQIKALEQQQQQQQQQGALAGAKPTGPSPLLMGGVAMMDTSTSSQQTPQQQVAQARLHRHRPLERTQSAPLPLGNPLLHQKNILLQHQQSQPHEQLMNEQMLKEHQNHYIKQHIRNTVLQRAGSKNHMENVDEETEAKLAQEMKEVKEKEDDDVVVIQETEPTRSPPPLQATPPQAPPALLLASELELQQKERESFLQQQRELVASQAQQVSPPRPIIHRPLSRTHSSPVVTFNMQSQDPNKRLRYTTGIAYDSLMLKHQCACGNNTTHPEHAGRLQSIWARLQETRLVDRCERVKSRKATIEELQSVHSEAYALLYGTNPHNRQKLDPKLLETLPLRFCLLPCGGIGVDSDTVWNEVHTSHSARMAAGCVVELAFKVAMGELKNGLAIVRPPGHHAEIQQPMGFCYFNSIAIAARQLRERLKVEKILILDWDVHHGNGTQQIFYNDPNVLYLSLHRHDNGNFFPGTGAPEECGEDQGLGFNVNLAWSGGISPPMGDAEYMAAFRTVIMPIARVFNPDIVLVSAGFDAATGHAPPLGGYLVSSACFGLMTRQVMTLAKGKVVLVLEGGYDLPAICDASEVCAQALLGDEIPPLKEEELCRPPSKPAIETLNTTIQMQRDYWPVLIRHAGSINYSLVEAQKLEREEADTVTALASLSMVAGHGSLSDTGSSQESEPMEES